MTISTIPSNPENHLDAVLMQQIQQSSTHFAHLKLLASKKDTLEKIKEKAESIFQEIQKGHSYYSLGLSLSRQTGEVKSCFSYMSISGGRQNCWIRYGKPERRNIINFVVKKESISPIIACDLLLSVHKYQEMLRLVKEKPKNYDLAILVEYMHMVSLARFAEKGVYEKEFLSFLDLFEPVSFMMYYSKHAFSYGIDRFSSPIDQILLKFVYPLQDFFPELKTEIDERMRKRITLHLIMAVVYDDNRRAIEQKEA